MFEQNKQAILQDLGKPDKSRAGKPDEQILPLLDIVNEIPELYTTSSCAGRNILMQPGSKKHQTVYVAVSHEPIEGWWNFAKEASMDEAWFKFEAMILHVCTKDLASAEKLIKISQQSGFKHSSIISTTPKIMVQIMDTSKVEAPIIIEGKLLVDEQYMLHLEQEANTKMTKTRSRMARLSDNLKNW